jgi:uncharacterized protein
MRVKDIQAASAEMLKPYNTDDSKTNTKATMEFKRRLTSLNTENYDKYIQDLTDKIYKQGELVAKKVDIGELQKYRELVTKLLNETVSNSFSFCKMDKFDTRGRHKVFALIRKVNQRLDDLTTEVLKDQADNIKLLNIVDDIRGLLVDIFL